MDCCGCGSLAPPSTQEAPSGPSSAVRYISFGADVIMNNGAPGPVVLTGPAIPLDGTSGAVLELTIDIEIQDTAPGLIPLTVGFTWGSLTSSVTTNLQSINGTSSERITIPIPLGAAPVGTATALTFTAPGGLAAGQQITILTGINNFSIFRYTGPWTFASWT